jgi:hypothetical protein
MTFLPLSNASAACAAPLVVARFVSHVEAMAIGAGNAVTPVVKRTPSGPSAYTTVGVQGTCAGYVTPEKVVCCGLFAGCSTSHRYFW